MISHLTSIDFRYTSTLEIESFDAKDPLKLLGKSSVAVQGKNISLPVIKSGQILTFYLDYISSNDDIIDHKLQSLILDETQTPVYSAVLRLKLSVPLAIQHQLLQIKSGWVCLN